MRKLAGGMTLDEIVAGHPSLTHKDILTAQEFAADYLADEQIALRSRVAAYLHQSPIFPQANDRLNSTIQSNELFY